MLVLRAVMIVLGSVGMYWNKGSTDMCQDTNEGCQKSTGGYQGSSPEFHLPGVL